MGTRNRDHKRPAAVFKPCSAHVARQAALQRIEQRIAAAGSLSIPAVPALLETYIELCTSLFSAVGRGLTAPERAQVQQVFAGKLDEAFRQSPRSKVVLRFESDAGRSLAYEVAAEVSTIADAYERWIGTSELPLFGTHADARIWSQACQLGEPASSPLLDLGAGTGRNAFALARRGYPVDAVEITPKFAEMISAAATRDSLAITVIARDVMANPEGLRTDYRMLFASEVVPDFRGPQDLRRLFLLANRVLTDGGFLVFNVHLAAPGYTPDKAAREFAQQCYSAIFTSGEIEAAAKDLPFELVSNDSVHDYEREHLPSEAWPPTPWFINWSLGLDVFETERDRSPIELRWLAFKKHPAANHAQAHPIRAALDRETENSRRLKLDAAELRRCLVQRLKRRWVASGSCVFPALPACRDYYVDTCMQLFEALGRSSVHVHRLQAAENFERVLEDAYSRSARSNIVVSYEAPMGTELHYAVTADAVPLIAVYEDWFARLPAPLFGANPDARLVSLLGELPVQTNPKVLDVGAGTGRNGLYLAQRGFTLHAIELTPKLADVMRSEAVRQHLSVQVTTADLFDALLADNQKYSIIVISGVACDFRSNAELRRFFELAVARLTPGGLLLISVHVAAREYAPDAIVLQWAQQCSAMFFSRQQLVECTDGLGVELVSDDSAYEFESAHLPVDAWPPTPVFVEWATCQHVFALPRERCPVELRWLVYRRLS
jgi:SAM-dependent methyltransferase